MSVPDDPLNFIPADLFFPTVPNFQKPTEVVAVESSESIKPSDPLRYAAHITLGGVNGDSQTQCLVQFVTPLIWRIRYDPKYTSLSDFEDTNTRTIVRDTFSGLVDGLQQEYRDSDASNAYPAGDGWFWRTSFKQLSTDHWVLTSNEYQSQNGTATPKTSLHIFKSPFRIVATRKLKTLEVDTSLLQSVGVDTTSELEQIIWQTTDQTFSYQQNADIDAINNVVLNVKKPGPAEYLGFGEQGGKTVLKKPSYLNYFCYDNFNYLKVYGQGALDGREPLYQSSPFYLEMNGTPTYQNVTGVMVDNYSQVAIDLGKNDSNIISIATRFNTFDAYILTADDVPAMIWQYTSIVGRPKLKPRYILGHHQGCYGYANEGTVYDVVNAYRGSGIPLDGMHLDVDFQERYRTFTSSRVNFPDPKRFFGNLKKQGIKACTNITPILTLRTVDEGAYKALDAFWDQKDPKNPKTNMLVNDTRYTKGLNSYPPTYWRYDGPNSNGPLAKGVNPTSYDNDYYGQPQRLTFADYPGGPTYLDSYDFHANYNSGYPFHGGVSYGQTLGTPGYYPDLNRADAREVWGKQYQDLFDNGLEFVWQDMTTPAVGRSYGDMLGFPSRLHMTEDSPISAPKIKTAIELWSLYSYNLHKATYHGLSNLKGRENKRNFIIGRGSQTGMHRFAGLWTGDNGSSWDFWKISVAQALALGYSGLTIAGVDMGGGGFTSDPTSNASYPRWCNPELFIRWYSGAFLLPWYRNHYMQHWDQESNPPAKVFQEPWAFSDVLSNQYAHLIPQDQRVLYEAVVPICRYYVQLRYSLIQVLYDCMFANLINGLPIARAMLITDPLDTSLFNSNEGFIDTQYLLGHNILVCPIVDPQVYNRDVYLPGTDLWYPSNLRVDNQNFDPDPILKHAADLEQPVKGGRIISYGCSLPAAFNRPDQVPFITPVYIRGGAIIPQLDVRQFIGENDLNPPTIHFYPGGKKVTSYSMYLDDGVSKDSAPNNLPQYKYQDPAKSKKAKGFYREVKMTQESTSTARTLTIRHPWNGFDAKSTVGDIYNFAVWTVKKGGAAPQVQVSFQDENGKTVDDARLSHNYDSNRGVLTVSVPVELVPSLDHPATTNGTLKNASTNGASVNGHSKDRHIAVKITGLT